MAIFDLNDYIQILINVFTPDKFVSLPRNPLKSDITKFRALAFELEPYLANTDTILISPIEGLKRAYGLPKLHKVDIPVRPIVSSINSVTSGAEIFLKRLIQPILEQCTFSCNSTKDTVGLFYLNQVWKRFLI